ncbi:MAG: hypothetical protein Q7S95_00595 [bacterium]|nr:hypothetical protein [bacterium]
MRTRIPVRNYRRAAIQTIALRTLYVSGALSLALLAPKMTRLLPHPDASKAKRRDLYARIDHARRTLKQRGLIEEIGGRLRLTDTGQAHIERILIREYKVPEPVRWDGKWRILMFDIREKRRGIRTRLRKLLQGAAFFHLQDSVWIYPYPCDEFVALVRAHLASGVGELRVVTADALEADRPLREHFGLA